MPLNEVPQEVNWPAVHYVYVMKTGPFQDTAPACWKELKTKLPQLPEEVKVESHFSLYKTQPEMIYSAGVAVSSEPSSLPEGLAYMRYEGGKLLSYTLNGPYEELPEACGRVFELVKQNAVDVREGFFVEHYVTNPATTPAEETVTNIMLPIQ